MIDQEAVKLVKEALAGGKNERDVIGFMKQSGYTDQAIADVLAVVKKAYNPSDELAMRIAQKNNIPMQQDLPKLGPASLPPQQPAPAVAQKPKRFTKKIIMIICVFAAIIALAAIAIFYNIASL